MSDNPAVQATQPLVAQIVSGYVRKNQVALADIALHAKKNAAGEVVKEVSQPTAAASAAGR